MRKMNRDDDSNPEALEPEDVAKRKQAIFDAMSPRRQKYILRKGYEKWEPFAEPKDPIDLRKDKTNRTTQGLVREFLQSRGATGYSNAYAQGVLDICLGMINEDERYQGMYAFSCWYQELLQREGVK